MSVTLLCWIKVASTEERWDDAIETITCCFIRKTWRAAWAKSQKEMQIVPIPSRIERVGSCAGAPFNGP